MFSLFFFGFPLIVFDMMCVTFEFQALRCPTCSKILETLLEWLALILRFTNALPVGRWYLLALLANDELGDEAHQDGGDHNAHGGAARQLGLGHGSVSGSLGHFRNYWFVVGLVIAHG